VQVGGKEPLFVEAAFGDSVPGFSLQNLGVDLLLPQHLELLALGIVINAG
jgi:hypothetical protein